MNRKTLLALAAFAGLAIIAFVALRQPEKGERAADKPRPIAKITPGEVETLEVTKGGATTTLKKEGNKYKVVAPVADAADEPAAKAAFEAIEKLDLTGLVTDQKAKQAEFEVDDAKGVRVVAKSKGAGKVLADIVVGKAMGSGTMVRPSGKDEVWQSAGSIRYTFDKGPADWRDKSITTFTVADAEKIDIKAKDGAAISLKKNGDKWDVASSSTKIDKLDSTIPTGIVSALSSFKTNEFVDSPKGADTGLDAPALTVTVGLKGGKSASVLIGNKKGDDDFFIKAADKPQVFLAKKYNVERVNKRPIEFRDKTLCDVAQADLAEISVTNGDKGDKSYTVVNASGEWKATKPAKLEIDAAKVQPIAAGFKDWKAASFAEDVAPKAVSLDKKPKALIAVKAKKTGGCTVKIGDETKDKQNYYAQTGKSADVYIVPKWSTDRVLIKPDDLKKADSKSVAHK
jgi:hypothetical protein